MLFLNQWKNGCRNIVMTKLHERNMPYTGLISGPLCYESVTLPIKLFRNIRKMNILECNLHKMQQQCLIKLILMTVSFLASLGSPALGSNMILAFLQGPSGSVETLVFK